MKRGVIWACLVVVMLGASCKRKAKPSPPPPAAPVCIGAVCANGVVVK
jgi:hypothetical protein